MTHALFSTSVLDSQHDLASRRHWQAWLALTAAVNTGSVGSEAECRQCRLLNHIPNSRVIHIYN